MSNSPALKIFFSDDKNLWLRLKKYKDRAAFISAYDAHGQDIYRFIYYKVGDSETAKDLTSAVFVKSWGYVQAGKLRDFGGYKSLKSFLYRVARNTVVDHYRALRPSVNLADLPEDSGLNHLTEVDRLQNQAEWGLVEEKLKQLKSEYQGLIILRYINQLSIAEIADILGKTKTATRVAIFRALQALKKLINI